MTATFNEDVEITGGNNLTIRASGGGAVLTFLNDTATLDIGGSGISDGDVRLFDRLGNLKVHLNGNVADLVMGGHNSSGEVHLYQGAGNGVLRNLITPDRISMRNSTGTVETVLIDGDIGDIVLSGADCAEFFEIAASQEIDPGTVLIVDEQALLRPCEGAYDRRVAGIVSGAGGIRPGIMLGAASDGGNRVPIALTGKAFCKVDAQYGPIGIGDLLTSSPTKGYAMKATDPFRAFGSVIGKAFGALETGIGMVPVLVTLQ